MSNLVKVCTVVGKMWMVHRIALHVQTKQPDLIRTDELCVDLRF